VSPFLDLRDKHEESEENIFRFKASHHLGDRKLFIFLVSRNRADMPGEHKAMNVSLPLIEKPLHGRRDQPVTGENAEVVRWPGEEGCSNGRSGGFKPDGNEDNLFVSLPCDLHRLMDSLHHPDITTRGFERPGTARDPEEVAIRGHYRPPTDKVKCRINLPLGGDTDGTTWPHDNFQAFWQQASQSMAGDCGLMSPADMHKGEVEVNRFMKFSSYFFSEGHSRLNIYRFAVISILMVSADAVLNASPTIPGEILGISGNFLAVIILFTGILIAGAMFITVRWLGKKADMTESRIDDIIIASIGTPAVIAVLVISVYAALSVATLPPGLEWIVESSYFDAIYIIIGAWIVSGFVHSFISIYGARLVGDAESDIDERMIAIALTAAKYLIWFIAFLLILVVLEIDITALIAGAGIVGIAVGLAAKDFLSNFFGGAVIALDKPFKLYDRVKIDNYTGDVVLIGSRSTRLKTLDNQIVTIPNSRITSSSVMNYSMPNSMKVRVPVGIAYATDIPNVKRILSEIARELAENSPYILQKPEPVVYFLELGVSGLNFEIDLWTSDVTKTMEIKDVVNMRIARRFAEEDIEILSP
jgi:MscS family membrane protein